MGSPIPNEKNIKRGVKRCREFVKQWNSIEFDEAKNRLEKIMKDYINLNSDITKITFKKEGDNPIEVESTYKDGRVTKEFYKDGVKIEKKH